MCCMAKTSVLQSAQPIIPSSLARFVYSTERSDQGVTGLCGLPLAIEAFHALGLDQVCRRELQLKQRDRGPTEAQWVEVLTLLHLAGGTSLEDLRIFKQDDGLCRLWKIPSQVSPRSALDFPSSSLALFRRAGRASAQGNYGCAHDSRSVAGYLRGFEFPPGPPGTARIADLFVAPPPR